MLSHTQSLCLQGLCEVRGRPCQAWTCDSHRESLGSGTCLVQAASGFLACTGWPGAQAPECTSWSPSSLALPILLLLLGRATGGLSKGLRSVGSPGAFGAAFAGRTVRSVSSYTKLGLRPREETDVAENFRGQFQDQMPKPDGA